MDAILLYGCNINENIDKLGVQLYKTGHIYECKSLNIR